MRVVFFGTPEFAVPTLTRLVNSAHEVVGVVTQPDRPQGRSRSTLVASPVKQLAEQHQIPVFQPERPSGDLFLASLRRLDPEIGVVVAYGHILKPDVLKAALLGMLNVHASLLPRLRGAAPIAWAIARGDAETGISIMRMEAGLDTGPTIARQSTPIGATETAGELTGRLSELGAELLLEALSYFEHGKIKNEVQDNDLATYAPKITRETAHLDWAQTANVLSRHVRAFDPAPGAWTTLKGAEVKLFHAEPRADKGLPGMVLSVEPSLVIAAGEGAVRVAEVQPAGKRRIHASEWVRGRGVSVGDRFE